MRYGDLYNLWTEQRRPSATTARMLRTTLKYVATALNAADWAQLTAVAEQHALVLLEGVLSKTNLGAQSRSNYRNYLRRLYRFAAEEQIDIGGTGGRQLWAPAPNHDAVPRRAQVAYDRFVRWAIGRGVWPDNVISDHLLNWALEEKAQNNLQWRQDYARLQAAWSALAADGKLPALQASPLPPRATKYALPVEQWPANLRDEWRGMCSAASAALRKGGMRPWRAITQRAYEGKLERFLGWASNQAGLVLTGETWASLLSADRCQDYLNWLVGRTGNGYVNPGHTAFLRMARGFHRFLLNSPAEVVAGFTDLAKRCEVEERDKAVRMAPYPVVEEAWRKMLAFTLNAMQPGRRREVGEKRLAILQVNTIIFGLLTTRALRCANIVGIKIDRNLVRANDGFELRYEAREMKGHRKFETHFPTDLLPVLEDYLAHGYKALTDRMPTTGDALLVSRRGTPLDAQTFGMRVRRLTLKTVGKQLHPHIFRHIIATHAAQVWKMTPPELAAFLAHRSVMTVMRYYEVTNPVRAAERFDAMRESLSATAP